jgi:hypothetical protein
MTHPAEVAEKIDLYVEGGADPRSAADPRIGLFLCRRAYFIGLERDQGIARGPGVRPTKGSQRELRRVFQQPLATCGPIVNRSIWALPSRDRRECRWACRPSKWMKTGDSMSPPLQSGLGMGRIRVPQPSPDRQGGDPFFNGVPMGLRTRWRASTER